MRSTCSAVRISSGVQRLLSRGRGASEGPVERAARPRSRRRDVAGTSVMAWPCAVRPGLTRLTCQVISSSVYTRANGSDRAPSPVAGRSALLLSNLSALVRLSAVREDDPIEEPHMQFVVRSVGVTWELARRLGPYLMLEILLPGGTLLALLLFLYRRRQVNGATGARRNALTNQVGGCLRVR